MAKFEVKIFNKKGVTERKLDLPTLPVPGTRGRNLLLEHILHDMGITNGPWNGEKNIGRKVEVYELCPPKASDTEGVPGDIEDIRRLVFDMVRWI